MTIEDLLKENGTDYHAQGSHHHATRNWLSVDCPFCSPNSKSYRMGISTNGRASNCWSCGKHPISIALSLLLDKSVKELSEQLSTLRQPSTSYYDHATGKLELPYGIVPLQKPHLDYLRRRKLDPAEIIRLWNVQGIAMNPLLGWRIYIPIHLDGEVVSWTSRSINPETKRRYHSAAMQQETISHKRLLYGEDYARHTIIVCEGPVDVWSIGPGAVSCFGLAYTQSQVLRMIRYPKRIIVFDSEPNAQRQAHALCDVLSSHPGETYNVMLTTGADPGDSSKQEIKELRKRFLD